MRRTSGSSIVSLIAAVIAGVIIADILIHPTGTQAAGNAIGQLQANTFSALLGTVPGNPQRVGG